ncbi:MAG: peptidase S16 [Betaproteobacteria bacterium]|nr:peptidase S16 [Betaproteobacteria bacterium]
MPERSRPAERSEIPIFPLQTVLFPGGVLPLRIFEQRYLEMTKACLRDNSAFGVCLISEGSEVGEPALPVDVGCLARISEWEMPQLGIFNLVTRGEERFRLLSTQTRPDGLLTGEIIPLEPEPHAGVGPQHATCVEVLEQLVDKLGESYFPQPHPFDDATWVGYRLAELLPLDLLEKQRMLVSNDALARLDRVLQLLRRG